jgi:hypothetical protein
MAIGDTVQAGLGRMDFSAFQRAGEAQARANQAFGNAIGSVAKSYFDKKAKQKEIENLRQGLERIYPDAPPDLINSMSKNPTLIEAKRNKDLSDFRAQEFAMRKEEFDRQQAMLDEQKAGRDRFITMLTSQAPTGKLNEAGQDELERGLLFLAPGPEAQEKFRDELLQDPNLQQTEPVMGMTGNRFIQQFAGESPAVQERALAFMQANAPKSMTPKEEAELNKILLDNRKTELELSNLETPKETYKPGPDIMSNNIKRANDIMDNDGIIPATSFGGLLKAVPGTDAHKLGNLLQTIKGNIGFDYLQQMRENSPTGGALGQVSNQELSTLQSVFGSLEQTQRAEDLKYNLQLLNHVYNNIIHGKGKHDIPHPDVRNDSQGQTPQVDPSAPASQSLLDEIERKRQLRSKRAGL